MADPARTVVPARHQYPVIDDLGLAAARHADRLLAAARERGHARWTAISSRCRIGSATTTCAGCGPRRVRSRAAYGPKDSIRDVLPPDLTEPFLESIDRLLREINRSRG